MLNKKSQGISINVIIIAVIALIVLVVLVAVFTGQIGTFNRKLGLVGDAAKTCESQGGTFEEKCPKGTVAILSSDSSDKINEGKKCCVSENKK
ncbi:hypothetical protein HYX01_02730 [Candidatus Woesearchaeota archaeon]|nr:hypothetical protein [Candidatus Woesearchaeota archaeon]